MYYRQQISEDVFNLLICMIWGAHLATAKGNVQLVTPALLASLQKGEHRIYY